MPRRDSDGASVWAAPEGSQAIATSGRKASAFSTLAFMPSPTRGMVFARAGKSLLDTVPTILSPAPAAKSSSVMCGARVMARAAGGGTSATRAGSPCTGDPACNRAGSIAPAQAPAATQPAARHTVTAAARKPDCMRLHPEREVHEDIGAWHVVAINIGVILIEKVIPAYLHPDILAEVIS